jgi:hypothetical protein
VSKVSVHRGPPRRYPLSQIQALEDERLGWIADEYVRGEYDAAELERRVWEELLAELPHKERALPG